MNRRRILSILLAAIAFASTPFIVHAQQIEDPACIASATCGRSSFDEGAEYGPVLDAVNLNVITIGPTGTIYTTNAFNNICFL